MELYVLVVNLEKFVEIMIDRKEFELELYNLNKFYNLPMRFEIELINIAKVDDSYDIYKEHSYIFNYAPSFNLLADFKSDLIKLYDKINSPYKRKLISDCCAKIILMEKFI